MIYSHVRANSRVGTMPCRTFMGAYVNKAVHMYDSCNAPANLGTLRRHTRARTREKSVNVSDLLGFATAMGAEFLRGGRLPTAFFTRHHRRRLFGFFGLVWFFLRCFRFRAKAIYAKFIG